MFLCIGQKRYAPPQWWSIGDANLITPTNISFVSMLQVHRGCILLECDDSSDLLIMDEMIF